MSIVRLRPAALAAVLLLGGPVLLPGPAAAASGITSPGAGQVVTAESLLPLRAVVDGPVDEPSELTLQAPGEAEGRTVAVSDDPDGGELAADFDTSCPQSPCAQRQPAPNGTWTLRLSGAAQDERTFVLRLPPAVPEEVAAARSEGGVLVRWRQGDEPDLRAYRVEDARGRVVRDRIGLSACDPERRCLVEVPEAAGAWTVRAFRATCPDCTQLVASGTPAAVRLDGSQVSSPTPAPQGASPGTTSPTSGPEAAPGPAAPGPRRGPDQRSAFRAAFGDPRPAPAAPLPGPARRPALPAPPPDGAFAPQLGYEEREVVVVEPRPPLARARDAVTDTLGAGDRVLVVVLAALLVGASVWLRRWARRTVE